MPGMPWRSPPRAPAGSATRAAATGAAAVPGIATSPTPAPATSGAVLPGSAAAPPTVGGARPATTGTATARPRPTTAQPTTRVQTVTRTGRISTPASGEDVKNCAYFSGTSRLASGRTLILAMRNLDNGDSSKCVETVFGWDKPEQLASWQGSVPKGDTVWLGYQNERGGPVVVQAITCVPIAKRLDCGPLYVGHDEKDRADFGEGNRRFVP